MSGPEIKRLYFSTQEVCDIVHVRAYVLRQWTLKFSELKPSISKTGRRLYKPKDIKLIQRIKSMVDQGRSEDEIEFMLNHPKIAPLLDHSENTPFSISQIIQELQEILNILDPNGSTNKSHSSLNDELF